MWLVPPLIPPRPDDVVLIDIKGVFAALVIKTDVIPFARAFGLCAVKPCTTVPIKAPIGGPLRINRVCEFCADKAVYTLSRIWTKSRNFIDGTKKVVLST
jgi:hypothetical protein